MKRLTTARRVSAYRLAAIGAAAICLAAIPEVSGQNVPGQPSPAAVTRIQQHIQDKQANIDVLQSQMETLQRRRDQINSHQRELIKQQNALGVSNESFEEVVKSLQTQRVDLLIDLAGLEARQTTLLELQNESEQSSNPLIENLNQLLDIEKQHLDEIESLVESGAAPRTRLQDAKRRLLEVQIRLQEARQPAPVSTRIADGLWEAALDRAEKKARLDKIESLLSSVTAARPTLQESGYIQDEMTHITERLLDLNIDLSSAETQLQQFQTQLKELIDLQNEKF